MDELDVLLDTWRRDVDAVPMPPMVALQACLILLESTGRLDP